MMRYLILSICSFFLVCACASKKSKVTPEQYNSMLNLVAAKQFEIVSDMAYPQPTSAMNELQNSGLITPGSNANQINLIGNVNYLRIEGDSVFAELPYFGERRMNASYNGSDSSIIIKNKLQDYSVKDKGDRLMITFNAKAQTELLNFNIVVYPSSKTSMSVNGPTRVVINYTGLINLLETIK